MSQLSYTNLINGDQPQASGFNSRFLLAINLINSGLESDNLASSAVTAAKISSGAVTTTKLSHPILGVQSSNIASATTTDLNTATGNMVDITGTTTITGLGTVQAGAIFFVRFTGILTLTHNATSLILPTGANITTAADDSAIFESLGSGNWRCANYFRKDGGALVGGTVSNALSGSVIQTVNTQTGAVATGTTVMPDDDTIPQNTEGDQYMSLAITPNNASNKLKITVTAMFSHSNGGYNMCSALFQDSTANALAAARQSALDLDEWVCNTFTHYMTAGTTSSTTFKVRCGSNAAGTITFNGTGSARKLGGVVASSITIEEIKA